MIGNYRFGNFMNITAWILSILGVLLLGVLVDLIVSETRLAKHIRAVLSIITVFVIVAPIPGMINNIRNNNIHIGGDNGINISNDFAHRQAIRQYERALERALASEGWRNISVTIMGQVTGHTVNPNQIILGTQNLVIDSELEHINKYVHLRARVAELLAVSETIVVIT